MFLHIRLKYMSNSGGPTTYCICFWAMEWSTNMSTASLKTSTVAGIAHPCIIAARLPTIISNLSRSSAKRNYNTEMVADNTHQSKSCIHCMQDATLNKRRRRIIHCEVFSLYEDIAFSIIGSIIISISS